MATEFDILGVLQVTQDGAPRDLGSARQRGLLARLLIAHGRPVSVERLLDELWPEEPPDKARHTLHVYVSRVRGTLGRERERLTSDTTGYRLRLEPDELDATRFERLTADGRAAIGKRDFRSASTRLTSALGLWRGPALADFTDEPFAEAEATRLDQLRLAALEDRVRADLELGRHAELVEELRGLTLEQPFREALWEHYMLALYRSGRQAEALRVYAEARTRLADELGIEPGPALQRMERRVLAQDAGLELGTTHVADVGPRRLRVDNLPLQRTTFVGRQRDLAIARELLAASRLLTLTGPPGSGKTRMAIRLAHDRAEAYPDGVVFVSLASVSEPDRVEAAITAALQSLAPDDDVVEPTAWLRDRRCLLVLDNCEQIDGPLMPVSELLDSAAGLTVLATSRAPLRLAGEQEFPVLPLEIPTTRAAADPDALASYDGVALLVARARAADPGFELNTENARAVAGITARLDGLPLAIELGAGRLRSLSPEGLLERLEHRLPLLTGGAGDAVARHQTLRAAITWSYELLDPDECRLFRHLAVFTGTFTAEAAADVAELPVDDVWSGIESLLAKSLLYRPADVGEARFAMLQTLREFAWERLEAGAELEAATARHARFFLRTAEAAEPELMGPGHDAAMACFAREVDDIRAALRRCADGGDVETGLRLASATWRYWQAAGHIGEGREWLTTLLDRSGGSDEVRARASSAAAGLAYWQADLGQARALYEASLAIHRSLGDQEAEADTLCSLSMTATWAGEPADGARLAIQSRELCEELGMRAKVGETQMAEGFALWQQQRYEEARPRWEDALAIAREQGAGTLAVTQLAGLAGLEYHTAAPRDATRIALDALDQACDLENVALCVWLLDFVAAFAVSDEPETAVRVAGAADALRRASGGGMRIEDLHIEPARAVALEALDQAAVGQAWEEGRALTLDEAIEAARSLRPVSVG